MQNAIRSLKNKIVSNKRAANFFLKAVNLPVIGDLYDSVYLKHIDKKIKNFELMLTVEPNNFCNLRCVMCPYRRMKRKRETMSIKLFKDIINQAQSLGCKDVHLTQYNEPFTDKFLFERVRYLREKGMKSSFYSNGTLLNNEIRKKILENPPDLIRFSVDGSKKETFESIRKGANYEQVVENITSLYRERNKLGKKLPIIEVFFTILEKNKSETAEFLNFWKDKCDFASLYPVDSRESEDFVGINYKKLKSYPCFNPKRVLVLSNGQVALCCVDIDGQVNLGNLKKDSLKNIINSKRFREIYLSQANRKCNIEMCKKCSKLYIDSAFAWWLY